MAGRYMRPKPSPTRPPTQTCTTRMFCTVGPDSMYSPAMSSPEKVMENQSLFSTRWRTEIPAEAKNTPSIVVTRWPSRKTRAAARGPLQCGLVKIMLIHIKTYIKLYDTFPGWVGSLCCKWELPQHGPHQSGRRVKATKDQNCPGIRPGICFLSTLNSVQKTGFLFVLWSVKSNLVSDHVANTCSATLSTQLVIPCCTYFQTVVHL